ncbi:uncharacterized protein P174DRAFT_465305 [Aspergillus novofumigatus IBT 16806]|uniref:Uncharacterized protein n=1 Tax=Aspergillus novofumigatus (strain IBT 16806) TaxID=1392255 RepID=A0A2I1BS28_ASPN1|nr:uncharacterized protein P174DRAFT_465305 [Aspergillus novofumigatus IBT 16806]PKX88217.1 hypothetical protein P174DRAFT_465305 [Aspergillus novofumigatus IBT 16806]
MLHDGCIYKHSHAIVEAESLVAWYHTALRATCSSGGTSVNTQSHTELEFSPLEVIADCIFYSTLLTEYATAEVIIGSTMQIGTWRNQPASGRGIYHRSAPFNGAKGDGISGSCSNSI